MVCGFSHACVKRSIFISDRNPGMPVCRGRTGRARRKCPYALVYQQFRLPGIPFTRNCVGWTTPSRIRWVHRRSYEYARFRVSQLRVGRSRGICKCSAVGTGMRTS